MVTHYPGTQNGDTLSMQTHKNGDTLSMQAHKLVTHYIQAHKMVIHYPGTQIGDTLPLNTNPQPRQYTRDQLLMIDKLAPVQSSQPIKCQDYDLVIAVTKRSPPGEGYATNKTGHYDKAKSQKWQEDNLLYNQSCTVPPTDSVRQQKAGCTSP